jgi:phage baseplate assembly protein V
MALYDHIHQRALSAAARAYIAAVNDAGPIQTMRLSALLAGETPDGVARLQNYGFTSVPLAGAVDAAAVFLLGKRSLPLIIAADDRRYRVKGLDGGEVCVYTDLGQQLYLSRAGTVVKGGGLPITIQDTPSVTIQGDLLVTGKVVAGNGGGDQVGLQTHTHAHGPAPDPGT